MTTISGRRDPVVLCIGAADVIEAMGKGLRNFQAMPLYGIAIGAIYAAGGNLIALCATHLGMSYLTYPLAVGFALIGPFAAIALYDISRRREAGQPNTLGDISATLRGRPEIGWAATIVVLLIVSMLPFFLGLLITLPVLGHTTWRLYRRIVAPIAAA